MNIALIGYRGTGKSVVGKLAGKRLGMKCIGMDARIVEKAGKSIPEIVEEQGWTAFRDLESEVVRELTALDGVILDTGGGVIERPENIEALQATCRIIWLKASTAAIVSRIQGDTQRPSLSGEKSFTDEVDEILTRRTPIYAGAAEYEIDTDALTPQQVADRIVEIWEANG